MKQPNLRTRFLDRVLGDVITARVSQRVAAIEAGMDHALAAAVSVRVDDASGWNQLTGGTSIDRPWAERQQDLEDALDAYIKNFLVRRIVNLTTSYVVGPGLTVSSEDTTIAEFIDRFWKHPLNRMDRRLRPWCHELTRSAELFVAIHTNKIDGMSYVRLIPASRVDRIQTDQHDIEREISFHQLTADPAGLDWNGPYHPDAYKKKQTDDGALLSPMMVHFAVNRPVGGTRGESDLIPVLPWAKRYTQWLQDRVRLNRQRTRQAMLDITIEDDSMVETKRRQLQTSNPIRAGIYVHGRGETAAMHNLKIEAADVKDDGRALRLACATASNVGLHYLGEGESVNYATAREMGEPTARFYSDRQEDFKYMVVDIIDFAYRRWLAHNDKAILPEQALDLKLKVQAAEVARADNESLANAARTIVEAFAQMHAMGWADEETAAEICYKFAGEPLGRDEIRRILRQRKAELQAQSEGDDSA